MIATKINVDDLIGLPYLKCGTDPAHGVDCLWTVRQVCERLFPDFDPREMPVTGYEIEASIAVGGLLDTRWTRVNWCSSLGDIAFTLAGEPSVAIMDNPIGRSVITARMGRGVVRMPFRSLEGVTSVWRRKVRA